MARQLVRLNSAFPFKPLKRKRFEFEMSKQFVLMLKSSNKTVYAGSYYLAG